MWLSTQQLKIIGGVTSLQLNLTCGMRGWCNSGISGSGFAGAAGLRSVGTRRVKRWVFRVRKHGDFLDARTLAFGGRCGTAEADGMASCSGWHEAQLGFGGVAYFVLNWVVRGEKKYICLEEEGKGE